MSRTTQDKFFEQLEAIAHIHKLEVIDDHQFGNQGIVRLEREYEFGTVLTFTYSFQDGYATFWNCDPPFGDRSDGYQFPYVKPDEIQGRVLDAIVREIIKWEK